MGLPDTRILVVDDEVAVREMLEYGLVRAGFTTRTAADGHRALEITREWNPKLIVLDVMLPEVDGISILPAFRRITDVPIIMLSAKAATADKVLALSKGADDYVAKPFDLEELIARIHSALRRPRLDIRHTVSYADITIDIGHRLVFRGNRKIDLSRREFDLLFTFVKEPGRVFTRSQLLDMVWGIDRDVVPNVVETYVSYLRAKIDNGEELKLIRTVRGAGYVFTAEDA